NRDEACSATTFDLVRRKGPPRTRNWRGCVPARDNKNALSAILLTNWALGRRGFADSSGDQDQDSEGKAEGYRQRVFSRSCRSGSLYRFHCRGYGHDRGLRVLLCEVRPNDRSEVPWSSLHKLRQDLCHSRSGACRRENRYSTNRL